MKVKIIIIITILMLITISLYYTYATNVTMDETNGNVDLTYNINLTNPESTIVTVKAGKTKCFDLFLINTNEDTINYGLAYNNIEKDGIIVAQIDTSKNGASDLIDSNDTYQISLVIVNDTANDITYEIKPITGYKKGGSLITPTSYTLIDDVYSFTSNTITGSVSDWISTHGSSSAGNGFYLTIDKLQSLGVTLNTTTPSFNTIATTDEGMYATVDNQGTTYYFRGASTNNYVYFAGYYWRIIRINGDNSIRLIYDGTTIHDNGEVSEDRQIGEVSYYDSSVSTSSSTTLFYANSVVKTEVDEWYTANIEGTEFEKNIVNSEYCSPTTNLQAMSSSINSSKVATLLSAKFMAIMYDYYDTYINIVENNTPSLTCSGENNLYTSNIGMITADEIVLSGIVFASVLNSVSNTSSYLYTGIDYWTLSPSYIAKGTGYIFISSNGMVDDRFITSADKIAYKPVISLAYNTAFKGKGTKDDPFMIIN